MKSRTHCIVVSEDHETDDNFPINLPEEIWETYPREVESGTLMLSMCRRKLGDDTLGDKTGYDFTVLQSQRSVEHVGERILKAQGIMTVAVISVSTADSKPTHSAQELATALFDPKRVNLRTQYEACSFGKLQWRLQADAVFDVEVPKAISDFESAAELVSVAEQRLRARLFLRSVGDLADKVILCIPPGTGDWAASAGVNHWRVQLNNDWCTSLTGTVHELAHTLGLLHSNADGEKYADRSGMMGSGHKDSSHPQKCFNGYHSHQFGWYSDRTLTVSENPHVLTELATFVDYNRTSPDQNVIIIVAEQYYLQYNVAKGFNKGTEHARNRITITEPTHNGTDRLAGLRVGESYQVPNFRGSGETLVIEACGTNRLEGLFQPQTITVSIGLGISLCLSGATEAAIVAPQTQQLKNRMRPSLAQRFLRLLLTKPIQEVEPK